MSIKDRLDGLPWQRIAADLDEHGWATTGPFLKASERQLLTSSYDDGNAFRSTVVMARHGFGRGAYRYFRYPLPDLVQSLRIGLYDRLLATANAWRQSVGAASFPERYTHFLEACHAA